MLGASMEGNGMFLTLLVMGDTKKLSEFYSSLVTGMLYYYNAQIFQVEFPTIREPPFQCIHYPLIAIFSLKWTIIMF